MQSSATIASTALSSETLAQGQIIREPPGFEQGYWVGCPGACYEAAERAWYLTYRIRRPRGVPPDRGGEVRIARSTDLQQWEDVWSVTKDQYDSASIERSAIIRGRDGQWRYFTSYVDPADGRWCTVMLKAPAVGQLDPAKRQVIFTAVPLKLEGVKDPWILEQDGTYHLFLSVALPTPKTGGQSHETLDIFNTGECVSATGLATSRDLDHWEWQGVVFAPDNVGQASRLPLEAGCAPEVPGNAAHSDPAAGKPGQAGRLSYSAGWDCYCRRINSVVPLAASAERGTRNAEPSQRLVTPAAARYLAFYDGSASHLENYEEKTGLAISTDLRSWKSLTPDGPALTSPHASHSLRYIDAQIVGDKAHVFYEFARPDGAHDLRVVTSEESGLISIVRSETA